MFTGIVQAVGRIRRAEPQGGDRRLTVDTGDLDLSDVAVGDSIATNGVCLTVIERQSTGFAADVSVETLTHTTLGQLDAGAPVNLEKALTPTTRLGGHLVSGHVDGVGTIESLTPAARATVCRVRAPEALARYIAVKGSICVDGVSLTVNGVQGAVFELTIVPHTWEATVFRAYRPGTEVNLEVDVIARYLERLALGDRAADPDAGGVTRDLLVDNGFMRDE